MISTVAARASSVTPAVRRELAWIVPLAALTLFYMAASRLAALYFDRDMPGFIGSYAYLSLATYAGIASVAVLFVLARLAIVDREPRPIARLITLLRAQLADRPAFLSRAAPIVLMPMLMPALGTFKVLLQRFSDFHLDPWLAVADRALHGVDPWQITHGLFGSVMATELIAHAYGLWMVYMQIVVIGVCLHVRRRRDKAQFLLSFALIWVVLGTLMAALMSSGGPCYYGLIVDGPDPFAPLLAKLRAVDAVLAADGGFLSPLRLQANLWSGYAASEAKLGGGISAMPSMHVAIAVLNALVLGRWNRWAGAAGWLFTLIVMIGSVHLAWHYALDGYVSIAATLVVWKLVGWALDRRGVANDASSDEKSG